MTRLLLVLLLGLPLLASDRYLFTSFRKNGESGIYFALSSDGLHWESLNGNKPWLTPERPGMLMRDPFLTRGHDGTWHLLWTCGWSSSRPGAPLTIGYARSSDLIAWTAPREIVVMAEEPQTRNVWAPEAVWDADAKEWIVFWSSTIPGRFASTDGSGDDGNNHRIYASRTRDWMTFTPAKLWFDPGFNCIDATVVQDGKRWVMIFKDERKTPVKKHLQAAFATSLAGPWQKITKPFTPDWVEGPSAIEMGHEWWIYFDAYTNPQHYGAVRTRDWRHFEDITNQLQFPADHRHGTVVKIREKTAKLLESQRR